jgi:hypothetical protein
LVSADHGARRRLTVAGVTLVAGYGLWTQSDMARTQRLEYDTAAHVS